MTYRIAFTRRAKKDYEALSEAVKPRILAALDEIARAPFEEGKPLKGELRGCFSHRMGNYRIVYQIQSKQVIVLVLTIAHRREAYR
ncbi:MAG: type II toxin-antitoxin system RelE/ParE family toxin [candidate division Zixibacteria bacterium]|nr:type II toxin-antitoxin system RelE/ParE family toxin [candidate division Zixibacteria bacterium]